MSTKNAEKLVVPVPDGERNGSSLSGGEQRAVLSAQQKRLWSVQEGGSRFSSRLLGRIQGNLDPQLLCTCLRRVAEKYEILHTVFCSGQEGMVARLLPGRDIVKWNELDLRGQSGEEPRCEVDSWPWQVQAFAGPDCSLLESTLVVVAPDEYRLLLRIPAACGDSLSLANLWREAAWCYSHSAELVSDEVLQYTDYAHWQQDLMGAEERLGAVSSWLEEPQDRRPDWRPSASSTANGDGRDSGRYFDFQIPEQIVRRLKQISGSSHVAMESILLASWLGFLALCRNLSQLCVGVSCDGRSIDVLKNAIGLFELYVPLSIHVQGHDTLLTLLRSAETALAETARYQQGINWEDPAIAGAKARLFEFGFSYAECSGEIHESGVKFSLQARHSQIDRFTLALHGCRSEEGLKCAFSYDNSHLQAAVINLLHRGFIGFLQEIAANPDRSMAGLESVRDVQRQLVMEWNQTAQDFPSQRCLHELFEDQAQATSQAIAVRDGERCVSYAELNGKANQIANELRQLGVCPETLVGICLKRSIEMVAGVLGILKAGGAYVPIDPQLPRARVAFLLRDTGVAIVLTDRHTAGTLPGETCLTLCLDDGLGRLGRQGTENPTSQTVPGNAAYVLYTSGSTGEPKGVVVPHVGIVNYLHWCRNAYAIHQGQGAPVQSSLSFDLTLTSLFGPLLAGRTVVLLDEEDSITSLVAALSPDADFSLLKITPAHLAIVSHYLEQHAASQRTASAPARVLVIGGEALHGETVARWRGKFPATTLVNEYGPTETVVGCCVYFVREGQEVNGTVPIGRPIANTQLYVLDGDGRPIFDDTPGELYVGGEGVSRGYLNCPGATAERFVPDPFGPRAGSRMYRTGDIGFQRADGELEYIGRLDRQVKIRGFRVELEEIETALRHSGAVLDCAVEVNAGPSEEKSLTAYVVSRPTERPVAATLRDFLSGRLPEYMVPSSFVFLSSLPYTPNGKVDRKALPLLGEPDSTRSLIPPRTETEMKILEVWEEVMQISPLGVTENFFALGGNSMLAVRIISRLEQVLNRQLSLALLFENKTIAELAVAVGRPALSHHGSSLIRIQPGTGRSPLFLVHPMGGGVFGYIHLARHLGKEQSVYGLQGSRLHGANLCRSIEEMATLYVKAMTAVDAKGPYQLGGWSMGGVVAFEMAQQLKARGLDVALLALIDSRPRPESDQVNPAGTKSPLLREIVDQFKKTYGGRFQWEYRQSELDQDQQLPLLLEQMKRLHVVAADTNETELRGILDVYCAHADALAAYVPRKYRGKLALFRSSDIHSDHTNGEDDPSLGWQEYSPHPVEIHFSPGSHDEMIFEPHVSGLARHLKPLLNPC